MWLLLKILVPLLFMGLVVVATKLSSSSSPYDWETTTTTTTTTNETVFGCRNNNKQGTKTTTTKEESQKLPAVEQLVPSSSSLLRSHTAASLTAPLLNEKDNNNNNSENSINISNDNTDKKKKKKIHPVKVTACIEALCPDCREYMIQTIHPTFQLLGNSVMELDVVAFGNAEITDKDAHTIECQHGVAECDANVYEQCAIHLYPYPERYLPYILCLDEMLPKHDYDLDQPLDVTYFAQCAKHAALDFESIAACHSDPDLVWKLQQEAFQKTPVEHEYVPWIVVNGMHIEEDEVNLLDEICKAYRAAGGTPPAACSSSISDTELVAVA